MQINVTVQDANNIVCEVVPPQPEIIVIDRGVEGNGIVSIVPVTISTFQYLRITYTNGTVQDVGPLTSTAYTATAPITIVGNTISLATVPIASGGTDATTAAGAIQNLLPSYTGNANKRLGLNSGGTALEWVADGGGTVTSINASGGTTGLSFTGGPITSSGTLTLSGTLAVANGGTGVTSSTGTGSVVLSTSPSLVTPVLGTPTSGNFSTGTFTWPTFNQNTTGTAANITATSNSTLTTLSALSLPGSQVSGNISGNAANVTGVVAISNGGTGQTTANAAFNALAPSQTGNSGKYLTTDGSNTSWATNPLGTVTSVAATVPSFLSVTGSPITTSGTLAFSLSGTALPTTSGGTGLTSFTSGGVVYASSTSALTTGSALTFDGTTLTATTQMATGTTGTAGKYLLNRASDGAAAVSLGLSSNDFSANNGAGGGYIFNISSAEQMRLTSTGLGIGTSSPAYKLQVAGTVGVSGILTSTVTNGQVIAASSGNTSGIYSNFSNTGGTLQYGIDNSTGSYIYSGSSNYAGFIGTTGATSLVLATNSVVRATIDASGNLGIGISSPAQKLHVDQTLNGSVWAKISNGSSASGAAAGVLFGSDGGDLGAISILSSGNSPANALFLRSLSTNPLVFGTNNTERARINNSGYFGIGQSNPQTALSFSNTASISWGTTNYPYIYGDQGNNNISIGTQGLERFRIDSSGNAAIGNGTTSANTISSALYFGNFGTVVGSGISVGGALIAGISGSPNWYNGTSLGFYTNPGPDVTATGPVERARLTASGELLIGRSSSSGLGQLQSDGGADLASGGGSVYLARNSGGTVCITGTSSYAKATINASSLGNNAMLSLSTPDGTYNPRVIISHVTSTSRQYVNFSSSYSTGTGVSDWAFDSGNFIIGATSTRSSAKLDIRGDVMTLGSNGSYYATIDYNAGTGLLSLASESGGGIRFLSGTSERARINASNGSMSIGTTTAGTTGGLRVQGIVNPVNGIVAGELISGFVALNYSGTRYWVLHNMTGNPATAFNCMGSVHASSYTTWNLSNLWIRRTYNSYSVSGGITGIIQSGVTVSIVDITYSGSRYVAIKFAGGDPGIEANLIGYSLNSMYTDNSAFFINGTSGVTENAVIASY